MSTKVRFSALIVFSIFLFVGCASLNLSPELAKVAKLSKAGQYKKLDKYFGKKYVGLDEKGVKKLFAREPQQIKPDEGVGFEEWDYTLEKPKVLKKEVGALTTVKRIKLHFLRLAFQGGKVIGVTISDPEVQTEQKGILNRAISCLMIDPSIEVSLTPELALIAKKIENGWWGESDKIKYLGLTEEEVRELLGDPRQTNPNRLTRSDQWFYLLKEPEVLSRERGAWTTVKNLKVDLLIVVFKNSEVVNVISPSEPQYEKRKEAGVIRKLLPCLVSIGAMAL